MGAELNVGVLGSNPRGGTNQICWVPGESYPECAHVLDATISDKRLEISKRFPKGKKILKRSSEWTRDVDCHLTKGGSPVRTMEVVAPFSMKVSRKANYCTSKYETNMPEW